jgi:hypothetical protein
LGDDDENVPFVVRAVAYDYISGNGLKDTNDRTRRRVVRSVLKVLHNCQPRSIALPDFDDLTPDGKIKAQSLVDMHVLKVGAEKRGQVCTYFVTKRTDARQDRSITTSYMRKKPPGLAKPGEATDKSVLSLRVSSVSCGLRISPAAAVLREMTWEWKCNILVLPLLQVRL